jgi:hypothetical protein
VNESDKAPRRCQGAQDAGQIVRRDRDVDNAHVRGAGLSPFETWCGLSKTAQTTGNALGGSTPYSRRSEQIVAVLTLKYRPILSSDRPRSTNVARVSSGRQPMLNIRLPTIGLACIVGVITTSHS